MSFKLYSDSISDQPVLICDVCSLPIIDLWSGKATGSPVKNGQLTDIIVHHPDCAATGDVNLSLIDFLRLFATSNRIGNLGSSEGIDKVSVEYPTGKGFAL